MTNLSFSSGNAGKKLYYVNEFKCVENMLCNYHTSNNAYNINALDKDYVFRMLAGFS